MFLHKPDRRKHKRAAFAFALVAGLSLPALAAAGQGGLFVAAPAPLGGSSVPASSSILPTKAIEAAPRVHVAQSQEAAQLALRIQQLEEQIRLLTGQVEGLQFQLTQMQTLIERQTEDNEFRFQALEGGAGGKTDAAAQPGGVTPSGELPQSPGTTAPAQPATPAGSNDPIARPAIPADPNAIPEEGIAPQPGEVEIDPTFEGPGAGMDNVSRDPLLGTGQQGEAPLGPLSPEQLEELRNRPLNLSLDSQAEPQSGDARAQYEAGRDALSRGDYAFAEEQFEQFVALYPNDPQAADATNGLGEALIQRGAFDQAADVLLTGYQNYPDSPRAPDLLLKLGISLAGAGEVETACRTFGEISRRYTDLAPALRTRLADEMSKAQCPA